jgi:type IV pilus assembly protein PilW
MFVFNNKKGFTLIELMIAMAISTLVMAAIYSTYRSQLRSHITQQAIVEMQQNARAAMFVMEREIKMAGYDPDGSQGAGITAATGNSITFTISANADGIDNDGDGDIDADDSDGGEVFTITYSLAGQDLQRTADGTASTVAENIEVLDFFYFQKDDDGNLIALPPPVAGGDLANIYSVQITTITRSGDNVPALMMKQTDHKTYTNQQGVNLLADPNDNFRRIVLTADVQCRNLGL